MSFDLQDDEWTFTGAVGRGVASLGSFAVRNPSVAGATTAAAVAVSFFTANAVLFQDHQHPSAFFVTRPDILEAAGKGADAGETPADDGPNVTRFVLEADKPARRQASAGPAQPPLPVPRKVAIAEPKTVTIPVERDVPDLAPDADRAVFRIQDMLAKLGYYDGALDGLDGPKTDAAISDYKQHAGLRGIELTNDELITSIRNNMDVTAAIPAPRPEKGGAAPAAGTEPSGKQVASAEPTSVDDLLAGGLPEQIPSAEVVKVQAALRAFGNTDVSVDGIAGSQTQQAIREFQTLFKLPVTGQIDDELLTKMQAVGLIQ